jgi:salicylate hydroxylase
MCNRPAAEVETPAFRRARSVDQSMQLIRDSSLRLSNTVLSQGSIALLGDACHPTLPYQGQGAAMAVEDGAILGLLLNKLQAAGLSMQSGERNAQINTVLRLYEQLRKDRTKTNVAGAVSTRHYYHLHDGEEQRQRDEDLAAMPSSNWQGSCAFIWADAEYQRSLLGFDVLADASEKFDQAAAAFPIRMPSSRL